MEHTANLILLPLGVQFPPELEGKITFDAVRRCLVWRGFMTDDELRKLLELDTDSDYRSAVASLFERCNRLETPLTLRLNMTLVLMAAVCLIGAIIVLVGVALTRAASKHDIERGGSVPQTIEINAYRESHSPEGLIWRQGGKHA